LTDVSVEVPGYGTVVVDIAFGGSFFALVHASQYNMDIKSSIYKIKEAAGATTGNYHAQQDVILVDECLHVSTLYFILSFILQ
jgi:proline racemase